jgi:hypothetical protein
MPLIQYVPVVLSVEKHPTEVAVNGRSPTSAVAENAWKYTSTA